jgi:hypothetical protein
VAEDPESNDLLGGQIENFKEEAWPRKTPQKKRRQFGLRRDPPEESRAHFLTFFNSFYVGKAVFFQEFFDLFQGGPPDMPFDHDGIHQCYEGGFGSQKIHFGTLDIDF